MCETIGNIRLNYEFYKGNDLYCDGDIEDEILEMVRDELDLDNVIASDNRWPILYHLSSQRENILDWYEFKKNATILEIGSGCGAITPVLSRNAKHVTCIELSKKRSEINAYKNRNFDNIEIIIGNLNDINLDQKYDYVTIIGVLEYAKNFTNTENPFEDFIKNIKKYLKPEGQLIIAIENKFGLKYWAGCKEDHTGKYFDGLYNYIGESNAITFSKKELMDILKTCQLKNLEFYYPMPDYKFPTQIYSDKKLPDVGDLRGLISNYDQDRIQIFDEELVYDNLCKSGSFDFFSNSFLVVCQAE